MNYLDILDKVGKTPIVNLISTRIDNVNIYAKLEYYNPTGSVKDRAANYIIHKLLKTGDIDKETALIESSSGNFGIALAAYCKKNDLKFICVIDPNTLPINEIIIKKLSYNMEKVMETDGSGGYLLNRIKRVKEIKASIPNSYWINQYANPYNAEAYYNTLGNEICDEINPVDYAFVGVSSGGTITGVSRKIKERYPNAKIVAVDMEGSVIFGGPARTRYIPGIGSGMVPEILKRAKIDDVVIVNELETIQSCHELLAKHSLFVGGSSGSVFCAVKKYFKEKVFDRKPNVVIIFPDKGDRYSSTIYNDMWCSDIIHRQDNYKEIKIAK